jgi:hypothetical protein
MSFSDGEPPESTESAEPQDRFVSPPEQAMCYCPVCSQRLLSQRCKLVCEQCGYFMSCADYY